MFKNLFNKTKEESSKNIDWIPLTESEQLETIIESSNERTQLIFKHSTRCGISRMVLKSFENDYTPSPEEADAYYLDLLNYREISNKIADKFEVFHQSPQLIVIKSGKIIQHASHGDINEFNISEFI